MRSNLHEVTQRIEMLEREVAKKTSNAEKEQSTDNYGPEIVDLLSNILAEMKKFNAASSCGGSNNRGDCCQHGKNSSECLNTAATPELLTAIAEPNILTIPSTPATLDRQTSNSIKTTNILRVDDCKMRVSLADGTIAIQQ